MEDRVAGGEWRSGGLWRGDLRLMREDEALNQARGDAEGPDPLALEETGLTSPRRGIRNV